VGTAGTALGGEELDAILNKKRFSMWENYSMKHEEEIKFYLMNKV